MILPLTPHCTPRIPLVKPCRHGKPPELVHEQILSCVQPCWATVQLSAQAGEVLSTGTRLRKQSPAFQAPCRPC